MSYAIVALFLLRSAIFVQSLVTHQLGLLRKGITRSKVLPPERGSGRTSAATQVHRREQGPSFAASSTLEGYFESKQTLAECHALIQNAASD